MWNIRSGIIVLLLIALSAPSLLWPCDREKKRWSGPCASESFSKAEYLNAAWGFPISVVGVSGYNSDCKPSLTADGRYMYFIAHINNGPPYDDVHYGSGFNVYVARWTGAAWDSVRNVGSNINPASYACISPDGKTLFYTKGNKIWMSTHDGVEWMPGEKLPYPVNDPDPKAKDIAPFVSANGTELYFASDRLGGFGMRDIYVVRWNGTTFDSLTNLGPGVNTEGSETHPAVSPDRQRLYFSDFGGGGPRPDYGDADLYVSEWTGTEWGEAALVSAPINTDLPLCSCFPTADGGLYVASEVSEGGFGEEDIWFVENEEMANSGAQSMTPSDSGWHNTGELPGAWYVHSLIEAGPGTLYAGTAPEGDVFKSVDWGETWTNTSNLAGASLGEASRVYSLLRTREGTIYAGTYPHGDVFKTTDGGATWANTADLPGATAVRALLQMQNGSIVAGTSPDIDGFGQMFRTINGGQSWLKLADVPQVSGGIFALFEPDKGVLFAGGRMYGDIFYVSPNGGQNWNIVNLPYDDAHVTLGNIYFFTRTSDGTIWTGGWAHGPQGILLRSTDNGITWDTTGTIKNGEMTVARVFDLVEAKDSTLYIGFHPGSDSVVFKSTDHGQTWSKDGALDGAREALCLLRASDGTIFAGTTPNSDVFRKFTNAKGDVNNDGIVNVIDVIRTVNFILQPGLPPIPSELWAADLDGNGIINVLDVVNIVNVILGSP
ncbi:MAG: dockerin type I domain-containing protein [bacterium]